jgi:hypothetical protein
MTSGGRYSSYGEQLYLNAGMPASPRDPRLTCAATRLRVLTTTYGPDAVSGLEIESRLYLQ